LDKAKRLCLISRALAVPQAFEPKVEVKLCKVEADSTVLVG